MEAVWVSVREGASYLIQAQGSVERANADLVQLFVAWNSTLRSTTVMASQAAILTSGGCLLDPSGVSY